jgi:hypothetical protein
MTLAKRLFRDLGQGLLAILGEWSVYGFLLFAAFVVSRFPEGGARWLGVALLAVATMAVFVGPTIAWIWHRR